MEKGRGDILGASDSARDAIREKIALNEQAQKSVDEYNKGIDRTYSADAHGSAAYARTRQNAEFGSVVSSRGVGNFATMARMGALSQDNQGHIINQAMSRNGLSLNDMAMQNAIGAVSPTVDGAVASHKMERMLDSHFQGLNDEDKAIAMAHGYSPDANAAVKMQALTKATMNYQMQSVESGFLHSMSFDASTGGLGTDVFRRERGLNARAGYNVDYGGEAEYMMAQGGTAKELMVASGFSSAAKDIVGGLTGLFGGKKLLRNLATSYDHQNVNPAGSFVKMHSPAARGGLKGGSRFLRSGDVGGWKAPEQKVRIVDVEEGAGL
ncbi:hypothetical protein [Hydrogenimonas cancrithermarum]|uniref:Uncharacterized protein n=1 Tax=Hydrogenimonas cancrithermarum TaxID=2993563 RepID=A0ABN6WZY7_9BACT|nr:hypothetical protein [Hydrogenimonas cancrithermarum]BDY13982.1 hypothetical protein HCR_22950 [Hydrogenimonas cancrithermarum]